MTWKPISLAVCLFAILAALAVSQEAKAPPAKEPAKEAAKEPQPAAELEPVRKSLAAYVEAFNKHDAKAAGAYWAEKAIFVDHETGERTEGRATVEADLEALFKAQPEVRLVAQLDSLRLVRPDVAFAEGRTTMLSPGEEPAETAFSAVVAKAVVREGEIWQFESVQETSVPTPETAADALSQLEWMVGKWMDDSPGIRVETSVRWGAKRSFLVRSYVVQREGEDEHQGTQVIGWDPRQRRIRSWMFDSDGSFGEGAWSQHGNEWHIRVTRTLADGEAASGTQIVQRVNDNELTVQTVGLEVAGQPMPTNDPVRVLRAPDAPPTASAPPAGVGQPAPFTPAPKK